MNADIFDFKLVRSESSDDPIPLGRGTLAQCKFFADLLEEFHGQLEQGLSFEQALEAETARDKAHPTDPEMERGWVPGGSSLRKIMAHYEGSDIVAYKDDVPEWLYTDKWERL